MSRLAVGALLKQFGPTTAASAPATPTLAVNATGTTATITGSTVGTTNTVKVASVLFGQSGYSWVTENSRTGDGTVALTLAEGQYLAHVLSTDSGGAAISNVVKFAVPAATEDALEVQIADAIVTELNDPGQSWSGAFGAERDWLAIYREDDLESLHVSVSAAELSEERLARGAAMAPYEQMKYRAIIDFQQRVTVSEGVPDDDALRGLAKLTQDVHDFFRDAHVLTGLTSPRCKVLSAERETIYEVEGLHQQHAWETFVALTVGVCR